MSAFFNGSRHRLQRVHQRAVRQEHDEADENLNRKVAHCPGNPAGGFRGEDAEHGRVFNGEGVIRADKGEACRKGDREEQRRVQHRAQHGARKWRMPPALTAQAIEHGNIQQLADQIGGSGSDSDSRNGGPEGERDADDEAGKYDAACDGWSKLAIREIGDKEGNRIGEGAPSQKITEVDTKQRARQRVLHQNIGRHDDERHQQHIDQRVAKIGHFFILGDATSWSQTLRRHPKRLSQNAMHVKS
ncbi:Hypothetical protein AT6N2_L0393 [Agrobacterium tumefaciens]|nr:Hypothetical protein AT6N2_L0393 [Agrobacterium tumefaciens]